MVDVPYRTVKCLAREMSLLGEAFDDDAGPAEENVALHRAFSDRRHHAPSKR
jgi:hypothetical protein